MHPAVRSLLPKSLKPHTILRGPLRGAKMVTSWHDYPNAILGRVEPHLIAWLSRNVHAGETWLDVGAHHGYMSLVMAKLVGSTGTVFAFEPVPETASALTTTARINSLDNIHVVPAALSDHEATLHLPVVRGMAYIGDGTAEMHAVAFDDLCPNLDVDGVKMDVQGMELEALTGMLGMLCRCHPQLIVEVHHGVCRNTLLTLLASVGYTTHEPIDSQPTTDILDNRSYVFH